MTYKYGATSLERLATCDSRIQTVFREVMALQLVDITIVEGHRSLERQKQLFDDGKSQIDGISQKGNHNYDPSRAVDACPYPIDWGDRTRFALFAGVVLAVAQKLDIPMRSGIDWDMDFTDKDTSLWDGPHFELIL